MLVLSADVASAADESVREKPHNARHATVKQAHLKPRTRVLADSPIPSEWQLVFSEPLPEK